jgi:uncharacterized protein YbbK (DUF523 family)
MMLKMEEAAGEDKSNRKKSSMTKALGLLDKTAETRLLKQRSPICGVQIEASGPHGGEI